MSAHEETIRDQILRHAYSAPLDDEAEALAALDALAARVQELESALQELSDALGVPGIGYPPAVVNACLKARAVLVSQEPT